jgi:hypothetical protein
MLSSWDYFNLKTAVEIYLWCALVSKINKLTPFFIIICLHPMDEKVSEAKNVQNH